MSNKKKEEIDELEKEIAEAKAEIKGLQEELAMAQNLLKSLKNKESTETDSD